MGLNGDDPRTDTPVPFIVGVSRSGTTLLRAMLASHPDLSIPEEADFLVTMSLQPRRYERTDGFDLETFLTDLLEDPHFRSWGVSEKEARTALSEVAPRSLADAMRALFIHCARRDGKTRYGNKTPQAVEAIPRLAQLFPEARFIHIIRDGRDVALSHIHTVGFMRSVGEVALLWRAGIEQGQIAGRLIGTNRYREVRYEDLVERPAEALRPLCEYVELDFHPAMLRYFERPLEILGSTQQGIPAHESLHLPPTKGLRDWRTQMSKRDLETFEAIAGDVLDRLGCERSVPLVPARSRLRATLVRAYVSTKTFAKERIPFLHPLYARFARQYVWRRRQLLNARHEPRGPNISRNVHR
jgi:hypothetical protein